MLTFAEKRVKTMAEPRVKNFLRVCRRNCCNFICCFDCSFHKVSAVFVFKLVNIVARDTEDRIVDFFAVLTLISNVVDCEYCFDVVELRHLTVVNVDVKVYKCCLPVVCVDNIRIEIDINQHFKNCFGEESKSFAVVKMTVKTIAFKVVFIIKEIINNAVFFKFKHTTVLCTPIYG